MKHPFGEWLGVARRWLAAVSGVILGAIVLAGCAGGWSGSAPDSQTPNPFVGVAIPEGYSLDRSETLVLGEGERWTGRLVYSVNSSSSDMYEFIRRQMPTLGWTEVSVVRAATSVMTYASPTTGRVATYHISGRNFPPWGTNVSVVVAPTGQQPGPVAPGRRGDLRGTPQAAPMGAVYTEPLR
jgi:hypothetical protein